MKSQKRNAISVGDVFYNSCYFVADRIHENTRSTHRRVVGEVGGKFIYSTGSDKNSHCSARALLKYGLRQIEIDPMQPKADEPE